MKKTVNVGMAGFGMAGEFFHAPLIHVTEGLVLHSILERTKERSKEKYSDARIVRSIEELIQDPEIDLVVLASPNDTHYEYAKKALLAGKHVVIDKPFVVKSSEGEELIALAKEQEKLLTVYQNRRLDGDFLTVKKLISEGALGDLHEYKAHYDRFRPNVNLASWKEGAGVFYDLGPHLIDQAIVLFGKPEKVKTTVDKQREAAIAVDYFEVEMEYPTFQVFLSAGMLAENPRPRFQLKGSLGTFTKFGLDPQENLLKAGALPIGPEWGLDSPENEGTLVSDAGTTKIRTERGYYPAYYLNVYNAIVNNEKLLVDPEDSLEGIRIIEGSRN